MEYKKIRERELASLKREMTARHKSEMACKEAEEKLKEMQQSMENHQREMQEARDTIARLEQQLQETQVRYWNLSLKTINWGYFYNDAQERIIYSYFILVF